MIEKLQTKVQNYDWGKLGLKSKVAQLWGNEIDETKPYAELWMGTHPNGPSFYEDGRALLEDINETTCTKQLFEKYKDLPFLFKVLSIRKALSIQAHPDKTLAARLHKESPSIYKDPNHKPEMAVALTDFEAFVGFRPLEEIGGFLEKYPEFKTITSPYSFEFVNKYKSNEANKKQCLKMLFSALQNSTPEQVTQQVQALVSRIAKSNSNDYLDLLILRLNDQYPNDVGIFCALFLNYICLKPGDAIFLAANEPHAYLSGDCIECMAASDNVVRSGLTPKFKVDLYLTKDVNTLVDMLTYNYGTADSQILKGSPYKSLKHSKEYNPPIEEFSILQTHLVNGNETIPGMEGPGIMIATSGSGSIKIGSKIMSCKAGFVYFVPAFTEVTLINDQMEPFIVYRAFCDECNEIIL